MKFTNDENGRAAVVAFMDIKSASKAHSTEIKLDGNVLHTEYSEASGGGVKVTRPAATTPAAAGSRYASSKPGYVSLCLDIQAAFSLRMWIVAFWINLNSVWSILGLHAKSPCVNHDG